MFIFVYDLTSKESFEKVEREIIRVREYTAGKKSLRLLIATGLQKADLRVI